MRLVRPLISRSFLEPRDPESARRALGIAPDRCLVYEDTDPGIEAARRAGMRFVDVRNLHTPRRVTGQP